MSLYGKRTKYRVGYNLDEGTDYFRLFNIVSRPTLVGVQDLESPSKDICVYETYQVGL